MKKFTKFLLALLLALTMAFVFAACADDEGGGGGEGESTGGGWDLAALKALSGGITLTPCGSTAPTYDSASKVVTMGDGNPSSQAFALDFSAVTPTLTVEAGNKIKVTYACVIENPKAKVAIKEGNNKWSTNMAYKDLESGKSQTLELTFGDSSTEVDGITVQHNNDTNNDNVKYYVKVLNVEIVTTP
jgi:hypothetical protein